MVVEKLKEREDARDARQDEENLLAEIERLKWLVSEYQHENDKLQISLKNAQDQYLVAVWELKTMKQKIDMLLAALKTTRKTIDSQIKTFIEDLS